MNLVIQLPQHQKSHARWVQYCSLIKSLPLNAFFQNVQKISRPRLTVTKCCPVQTKFKPSLAVCKFFFSVCKPQNLGNSEEFCKTWRVPFYFDVSIMCHLFLVKSEKITLGGPKQIYTGYSLHKLHWLAPRWTWRSRPPTLPWSPLDPHLPRWPADGRGEGEGEEEGVGEGEGCGGGDGGCCCCGSGYDDDTIHHVIFFSFHRIFLEKKKLQFSHEFSREFFSRENSCQFFFSISHEFFRIL